ncbi:hypothetical protein AJ80_09267 [Polytolypa hystricis UAMH7299]|uniref:Dihydrofolate reductase n=1 Tax=Polytolypa hystricis (strain UAMH7299) TaxID=1447883 RepID=A0A2B7WTI6_POLH7|nr:hypothetical protein AJ80_09267 [Polytolypa hystricis UAMH7299]
MPPHIPSPTTIHSAATKALLPPLTLIVATTPISNPAAPPSSSSTPRLGIGNAGTLPWPRIKSDMRFFARVTTRSPPRIFPSSLQQQQGAAATEEEEGNVMNAVIMGRKTYDSLPAKFRPLPRRVNVVISRDTTGAVRRRVEGEWRDARRREIEMEKEKSATSGAATSTTEDPEAEEEDPAILVSSSLPAALHALQHTFPSRSRNGRRSLGNIFIIGGGEIYASALLDPNVSLGRAMRIIMTDLRRRPADDDAQKKGVLVASELEHAVDAFECDTFFPIGYEELENRREWRRVGEEEVAREWVGEEVWGEWKADGEVVTRILGFERV